MSKPRQNSIFNMLGIEPSIFDRHAIMVPGPAIAEARGKAGGIIFSRNRGGQYIKAWASPINPQTGLQQNNRITFGSIVGHWNATLTPTERDSWNDFAQANPVQNTLGQDILLSGLNWYTRMNHTRLLAGLVREDDAPASAAAPATDPTIIFDELTINASATSISFDNTQPWALEPLAALVVFIGKPVAPGVSRFKGPWRFWKAFPGVVTVGATTPTVAFAGPWTYVATQKIFGKAIIVEPAKMPTKAFNFGGDIAPL